MRVWVLKNTPDYEQSTEHGIFPSPLAAWNDMFTVVDEHVFPLDEFHVRLLSEEDRAKPEEADIILRVDYRSGDAVTLTGVYVKGTGNPAPTLAEWRDFQQVGSLLMQHAVQERGFTRVSEYQEAGRPAGVWKLRKED